VNLKAPVSASNTEKGAVYFVSLLRDVQNPLNVFFAFLRIVGPRVNQADSRSGRKTVMHVPIRDAVTRAAELVAPVRF